MLPLIVLLVVLVEPVLAVRLVQLGYLGRAANLLEDEVSAVDLRVLVEDCSEVVFVELEVCVLLGEEDGVFGVLGFLEERLA